MSVSPIQIGVIGCGTISRNVHLPTLLALPDVQVVWLSDIDRPAGRSLSKASGIRFHSIPPSRIDLPFAHMVLLAIPNGVRDAYYDYFTCEKEVGLYIEKPLAKSVKEHNRIMGARAPWQVAVGLDRRSFGLTNLAQQIFIHRPFGMPISARIESGGIGRVLLGGSFRSQVALAGGGALYQMGVHFLDAILFISGAEDVSLRRGRMIVDDGIDLHVNAELDLFLPSGAKLPLTVLVTQLQNANNRITIEFERASVSFSGMYNERSLHVTTPDRRPPAWTLAPEAATGPLDMFSSFAVHWSNVIEAFRTKTENYTSASRTVLTSKALELLYSIPPEGA